MRARCCCPPASDVAVNAPTTRATTSSGRTSSRSVPSAKGVTVSTENPRQTVERFLKAVVSPSPGDLADCYADQIVIEMPFASGLAPERFETTREEIRQRFAAGAASRRYTGRDVRVHETAEPDVIVLEYSLDGTRIADGEPFAMTFVMVLTFRDGLIAHSRDYTDPIAGARALGRLPELTAALAARA